MDKPYIGAADRNKEPILACLRPLLGAAASVFEIGAGTGQHAVHFAAAMPWLRWQTSDLEPALDGIGCWVREAALPNLPAPVALDVTAASWPLGAVDAIYTANTVHYVPWPAVAALFAGAARVLRPGGRLLVYGPFNYGGRSVSAGNEALDRWLRERDPSCAIRHIESVIALGANQGLRLEADYALPANNRLLSWRRE